MDECSDLGEVRLYLFGPANVLLTSLIDVTELELIYDSFGGLFPNIGGNLTS